MTNSSIPGYVYLDSKRNIFYFLVKIDYININNTIITPSENNNITDQLEALNNLYKSGVLTKEEFEKAKKRILN